LKIASGFASASACTTLPAIELAERRRLFGDELDIRAARPSAGS